MADSKRVDGGSQEMEKNEMKKIEQTEGANLIINEKPDGSPKDIVSELSVEEQGDNTDVKTAESTKVQTGVENTNNIGTELAEDGQIIQKSTTLESQDQSSEAAKEEEAKSTDKVEEAGSTDKVEEAKLTEVVRDTEADDPALITSLVGKINVTSEKEVKNEDKIWPKELDTVVSDSQKAELSIETNTGSTNLQKEAEPRHEEIKVIKVIEKVNPATTAETPDKKQEEVKDTDSKTEFLEDTVGSDLHEAELSKKTDTIETMSQKEESRQQGSKKVETNDPALITSLVGHRVGTPKKEDTLASNSQKIEFSKDVNNDNTNMQMGEEPREQGAKGAEICDPALTTSPVERMVITTKNEEINQELDNKKLEQEKSTDSKKEVTVASDSKSVTDNSEAKSQIEEEPKQQLKKEAETNDPSLMTSLVVEKVIAKNEGKNLEEVKATDLLLETKQDAMASDTKKTETKSQKEEDSRQQGIAEGETRNPDLFQTQVGHKVTTPELQMESPKHEVKELSQENQSKRDEPKIAASDVPLQSNNDKEADEVKTMVDDPPAGISNENKNATEQKVKSNSNFSCQLL